MSLRHKIILLGFLLSSFAFRANSSITCDGGVCDGIPLDSNLEVSFPIGTNHRVFEGSYSFKSEIDLNLSVINSANQIDTLVNLTPNYLSDDAQLTKCLNAGGYVFSPQYCFGITVYNEGISISGDNSYPSDLGNNRYNSGVTNILAPMIKNMDFNLNGVNGADGTDVSELCAQSFLSGDLGAEARDYFVAKYGPEGKRCQKEDSQWLSRGFVCNADEEATEGVVDIQRYSRKQICQGGYRITACLERRKTINCKTDIASGRCCSRSLDTWADTSQSIYPEFQDQFGSWQCDSSLCDNPFSTGSSGLSIMYQAQISEAEFNASDPTMVCSDFAPSQFKAPTSITITPDYTQEYNRVYYTYQDLLKSVDRTSSQYWFKNHIMAHSFSNIINLDYPNIVRVPQLSLNEDAKWVDFYADYSILPSNLRFKIGTGASSGKRIQVIKTGDSQNYQEPIQWGTGGMLNTCYVIYNPDKAVGRLRVICGVETGKVRRVSIFLYTEGGYSSDELVFHIDGSRAFGTFYIPSYNSAYGVNQTVPPINESAMSNGYNKRDLRSTTGYTLGDNCPLSIEKSSFTKSELKNIKYLPSQDVLDIPANCYTSLHGYGVFDLTKIPDYHKIKVVKSIADSQHQCPAGSSLEGNLCTADIYIYLDTKQPISSSRGRSYDAISPGGITYPQSCNAQYVYEKNNIIQLSNGAQCGGLVKSFKDDYGVDIISPASAILDANTQKCYEPKATMIYEGYDCGFYIDQSHCEFGYCSSDSVSPEFQDFYSYYFRGDPNSLDSSSHYTKGGSAAPYVFPRRFDITKVATIKDSGNNERGKMFFQPLPSSWSSNTLANPSDFIKFKEGSSLPIRNQPIINNPPEPLISLSVQSYFVKYSVKINFALANAGNIDHVEICTQLKNNPTCTDQTYITIANGQFVGVSSLVEGVYTVMGRAVDANGKYSPLSFSEFVIDRSPPPEPLVDISIDHFWINGRFHINFTLPPSGGVSKVQICIHLKDMSSCSQAGKGFFPITNGQEFDSSALAEGEYTIDAVTTSSGPWYQSSVIKSASFVVDRTPPVISRLSLNGLPLAAPVSSLEAFVEGSDASLMITPMNTQNISHHSLNLSYFISTSPNPNVTTGSIFGSGGGDFPLSTTPFSLLSQILLPLNLSQGSYYMFVNLTDISGNKSATKTLNFQIQ